MNILLLASHAVAEYDDLRMFTDLGYDVFAPGGYEVPSRSGEGIRPALPDAAHHPHFVDLCNEVRAMWGNPGTMIDWAKASIHDEIIEWADVIIAHHFVDRWVGLQWPRIKHKRVIWRTCGQSNPDLERFMTQFVDDGLEVVRYSPAERRHFGELGAFAGEDAMIRFGKYPEDYGPWTGEMPAVINITQHMAQRGDACGYPFWRATTAGMARWSSDGPDGPWAIPLGPGSEDIGGTGALTYPEMLGWLRKARAYLYTGTTPASYTLGLIEAMMTGIPVVTIGAKAWGDGWHGSRLFEAAVDVSIDERRQGELIRSIVAEDACFDSPEKARQALDWLLEYDEMAATISRHQRARAIELFGIKNVGPQWKAFLG